jgi:transcriptional regulator
LDERTRRIMAANEAVSLGYGGVSLVRRACDLHGYGIVQFIQQSSDNELLVEEGSLYPALQRLELNGWIDGVWGVTSNNRRARIYKITAAGRKQLAVETRKYAKLTLAIARVMGAG